MLAFKASILISDDIYKGSDGLQGGQMILVDQFWWYSTCDKNCVNDHICLLSQLCSGGYTWVAVVQNVAKDIIQMEEMTKRSSKNV